MTTSFHAKITNKKREQKFSRKLNRKFVETRRGKKKSKKKKILKEFVQRSRNVLRHQTITINIEMKIIRSNIQSHFDKT